MLRYLKDKFWATSPQDDDDADDWIVEWTTLDDSANCPRQYNGYDCGVFTIVNMTLLAQNTPLSNTLSLYEEQDFQNLDTRRRIAYFLWKASSNRPQPTSTNRPHLHLDRALPSKRPSSSTTKAGSSSTKERQKKRRQNNRRVVMGSNRLRGKVTYDDPGPSDQLKSAQPQTQCWFSCTRRVSSQRHDSMTCTKEAHSSSDDNICASFTAAYFGPSLTMRPAHSSCPSSIIASSIKSLASMLHRLRFAPW